MSSYTFSIYKRKDGKFEWRCQERNGQIVATSGSQGYNNRQECEVSLANMIYGVQNHSYEVKTDEQA